MIDRILRLPKVLDATGYGRSSFYEKIAAGLFTRPVPLGARAVGWPESEVNAIRAAHIRGASEDEIKALVSDLHEQRLAAA